MTRKLSHRMSSEAILNNAIRHQRLCNEVVGAEKFATAIQTPIDKLKEKRQISLTATENKGAAYDLVVLKDTVLDDVVRDISDTAKQYDRKSVWHSICNVLFPKGKKPTITNAPLTKESDMANQLLLRLNSFEEGNSLLEFKTPLTAAIADNNTAITTYKQLITDEKKALADEALAQDDVVRQYEFNFLDATELFGKEYTNRLFPITLKPKKEELAEEISNEPYIMTYRQLS